MPAMAIFPVGFPGAFWFALVIAPVITAFFFRYRSQVREIPALSHWLTIGRPMDVRSTGALLRRVFSLLVQIILICLLVLCLANPFPQKTIAHRVGIVIDVSATMQTREHGRSRLDRALTETRKILNGLARDTQIYLVTAGNRPMFFRADTVNPAAALNMLDAIRASDTDADLPAAVRAISFLAADPAAKAIVISDFAGTTPPAALKSFWNGPGELNFIPIGTDHADAAIISSWAEPDGQACRVGARYTSRGLSGRTATARLISNGQTIAEKQITLKDVPDRVEFLVNLPARAPYEIVVNAGDDLAVDDHAFGVLPARPVICLVTEGDIPLERAIRADPTADLRIVRHDQYDGAQGANVVIVDGPGLRVFTPEPQCNYLFIDTADPFGFASAGPRVGIKYISHWRGDHPSLAEIDPSGLHFRSGLSLQPAGAGRLVSLLASDYISLISERDNDGRQSVQPRIMYWAFRLSDTDLPSRLSFPILLWDTLDYLAGNEDDSQQHGTGHPLLMQSTAPSMVIGPDNQHITAQPISSGFEITDTGKQGLYTIRTSSGNHTAAINLFSARGTLPLPRDGQASEVTLASNHFSHSIVFDWRRLLIAALVLAFIEWVLFHLHILQIG